LTSLCTSIHKKIIFVTFTITKMIP